MAEDSGEGSYIALTANIVSAYVSNNTVPSSEIANLIGQVHSALLRVSGGQVAAPTEPLKPKPWSISGLIQASAPCQSRTPA